MPVSSRAVFVGLRSILKIRARNLITDRQAIKLILGALKRAGRLDSPLDNLPRSAAELGLGSVPPTSLPCVRPGCPANGVHGEAVDPV